MADRNTRGAALLARARGTAPTESAEQFEDEDTKEAGAVATIARSGFGTLPVFVLTPAGCVKRNIAVQSIYQVLQQPNYSAECFDCGSDECSGEINGCPGRPIRPFRICPVVSCRKRIYDPVPTGKRLVDDFDRSDRALAEDGMIVDETYSASTPESRTKAELDAHLWGYHETEAATMGIHRPAWKVQT